MLNLYHIFSIVDLFIAAPIPRHFIIETSDTKLRHYDDLDPKENVDKGMVNKCHSLYMQQSVRKNLKNNDMSINELGYIFFCHARSD